MAVGLVLLAEAVLLVLIGKTHLWRLLFYSALLLFLGFFYYNFYTNLEFSKIKTVFNQEIEFSGIVRDEPRGFEKYQIFALVLDEPFSGEIRVFSPPLPERNYGDRLALHGTIKLPVSGSEGIEKPTLFFPQAEFVSAGNGNWLKQKLLGFKHFLLKQFDTVLAPDEASLLGGITFGARSGFSQELREQMAASGTTHIVALSGYNITILVLAIFYVFNKFFSRRKTFYISIFTIVLFVLMVGGEPSVVRAAIMGFLALLAKEIGRLYDVKNAIVLTAAAMAVHNPTILVHDVGFQLSFLSLLGIVYLAPAIKNIFKFRDEGFLGWRETAVLTLSAQLMVMPVLISIFGEFSLTAVLANILILAFIPLTMMLGFLLAAVSAIYSYLGFFAAKLVGLLLGYEILIIKIFAGLRLPLDFLAQSPLMFAVVYYAAIAWFIYVFIPRDKSLIK